MSERIDKLKAELPEHCWKCGDYTGTGDCIECHWSPVIKALTDGLNEAESEIAKFYLALHEANSQRMKMIELAESLRAQLAAARKDLEEADRVIVAGCNHAPGCKAIPGYVNSPKCSCGVTKAFRAATHRQAQRQGGEVKG